MACFHPLSAWQEDDGSIIFGDQVRTGKPIQLPCGRCVGCRLEHSRQWAMRCIHEASTHDDNCFITLTYDDHKLLELSNKKGKLHPALVSGTLYKRDYQLFMKRLRKKYPSKNIRYYHCGEYGDRNNRPHYHAILFNHNFNDWVYLFDSPSGEPIYTSPELESIWGLGFVTIGTVTFESAGYVARYCMKKINGDMKESINEETDLKHYERVCGITGEVHEVVPEYSTMSRRPGIGREWITNFTSDCYPKDFTTIRGVRMRPPKYYDRYLEEVDPELYDQIKQGRTQAMYDLEAEQTEQRLRSKEIVKTAQFGQLKRSL